MGGILGAGGGIGSQRKPSSNIWQYVTTSGSEYSETIFSDPVECIQYSAIIAIWEPVTVQYTAQQRHYQHFCRICRLRVAYGMGACIDCIGMPNSNFLCSSWCSSLWERVPLAKSASINFRLAVVLLLLPVRHERLLVRLSNRRRRLGSSFRMFTHTHTQLHTTCRVAVQSVRKLCIN